MSPAPAIELSNNVQKSDLETAIGLLEGSTITHTVQTPGMVLHKVNQDLNVSAPGMTGFVIFCTDGYALLIHDERVKA